MTTPTGPIRFVVQCVDGALRLMLRCSRSRGVFRSVFHRRDLLSCKEDQQCDGCGDQRDVEDSAGDYGSQQDFSGGGRTLLTAAGSVVRDVCICGSCARGNHEVCDT